LVGKLLLEELALPVLPVPLVPLQLERLEPQVLLEPLASQLRLALALALQVRAQLVRLVSLALLVPVLRVPLVPLGLVLLALVQQVLLVPVLPRRPERWLLSALSRLRCLLVLALPCSSIPCSIFSKV